MAAKMDALGYASRRQGRQRRARFFSTYSFTCRTPSPPHPLTQLATTITHQAPNIMAVQAAPNGNSAAAAKSKNAKRRAKRKDERAAVSRTSSFTRNTSIYSRLLFPHHTVRSTFRRRISHLNQLFNTSSAALTRSIRAHRDSSRFSLLLCPRCLSHDGLVRPDRRRTTEGRSHLFRR